MRVSVNNPSVIVGMGLYYYVCANPFIIVGVENSSIRGCIFFVCVNIYRTTLDRV